MYLITISSEPLIDGEIHENADKLIDRGECAVREVESETAGSCADLKSGEANDG